MENIDTAAREIAQLMEEAREKDADIENMKQLIIQLADALEEEFGSVDNRVWNLIQCARKALE